MWFLVNLPRLKVERDVINTLEADVDWLVSTVWVFGNNHLTLNADIKVGNNIFQIRMEYPSVYPSCPPSVFPRKNGEKWSVHQYLSGELCLEWGPDTWREDITGAQVLESLHTLLKAEHPTEESQVVEVPSRHALTVGQELRHSSYRFHVTYSLNQYLRAFGNKQVAELELVETAINKKYVYHVGKIKHGDEEWVDTYLPSVFSNVALKRTGRIFNSSLARESIPFRYESINDINEQLLEDGFVQENLITEDEINFPGKYILVIDSTNELHLFWFVKFDESKLCIKLEQIASENQDIQERMPAELRLLADKKIGIVGLGSVGGKIAMSIARTGAKQFLLIDDDIFMPENICRNMLDWSHVGHHKVDSLAHQLLLISKDMDIKVRKLRLSGQEAASGVDSALSQLGDCDIIIDATADPNTFNQLAGTAAAHNKPFVWVEVFAGGIGGLIARFRPSIEPHPQQMRQVFNQYTQECGTENHFRPTADYSAERDNGEVIVASDGEVSVIASHCVNLVFDSLVDPGSSKFPYSMYLIGLSKGWVFDEPFVTIPICMPDASTDLPDDDLTEKDNVDQIQFIEGLIKGNNESSSS